MKETQRWSLQSPSSGWRESKLGRNWLCLPTAALLSLFPLGHWCRPKVLSGSTAGWLCVECKCGQSAREEIATTSAPARYWREGEEHWKVALWWTKQTGSSRGRTPRCKTYKQHLCSWHKHTKPPFDPSTALSRCHDEWAAVEVSDFLRRTLPNSTWLSLLEWYSRHRRLRQVPLISMLALFKWLFTCKYHQ